MGTLNELDPEKEITDITFDFEGAHLAITHKSQGFSANNKPMPLLIKVEDLTESTEAMKAVDLIKQEEEDNGAEVMIETDMVTFLTRWMDMFFSDAVALASLLGFQEEETHINEFIEERMAGVTILKSASEGSIQMVAPISDIKKLQAFIDKHQSLKDSFSEGNPEMKTKETISKSPKQPSEETKTNQGDLMADKKTDQEIELEKATADFEARIATLEKAATDAEADKKELTTKVESFEKANQERLEKAFEAKVTTYSFITEEERADFAKALIEVDNEAVILALDKAQAAIVALSETQGVDGGELNLSKSTKSNRVKEMVMKQHGLTDVSK